MCRVVVKMACCVLIAGIMAVPVEAQQPPAKVRPTLVPQLGHSSFVHALALSGDDAVLATGSEDNTARLWELAGGRELRSFVGHSNRIVAVGLSADGKILATGSHDKTARLWDATTGKQLRSITHGDEVLAVALSRDGKRLATADGKTAQVWDQASGEVRAFEGHTAPVLCVALSGLGKWLITGSADKTVRLWDVATGKTVHTYAGHDKAVRSVALSADGKYLITGSEDKSARLWNVSNGAELRLFAHPDWVRCVAVTRDGKWLVSGCADKLVRVWDLAGGDEVRAFRGHTNYICAVAATSDSSSVVSSGAGFSDAPRLWDLSNAKELRAFQGRSSSVSSLALQGKSLFTGNGDGTIRHLDLAKGNQLTSYKGTDSISSLSASSDGKLLAAGSSDGSVLLWNLAEPKTDARVFRKQAKWPASVLLTDDAKFLFAGGDDNSVKIWEIAGDKKEHQIQGFGNPVRSMALSGDGRLFLGASVEHYFRQWDLEGFTRNRTLYQQSQVGCVAVTRNGKASYTGSADGQIRQFQTLNGLFVRAFPGHTGEVWFLSLANEDKWLISGGWDKTARVLDLATGKDICVVRHDDLVTAAALSSDGKRFITASRDQTTRVWDVATAKELCRIISFRDGWAVFDSAGRYDAGNTFDTAGLHWVIGNEAIPLGRYRNQYREAGLLAKVLVTE